MTQGDVPETDARPPRSPLQRALRWSVSLACLAYIGWYFYSHRQDLRLIANVTLPVAIMLLGLCMVYNLVNSCRYQIILQKVSSAKIPFFPWFKLFILALWLNVFFPQLGNLYRGVQLKKLHGVSYTHYISSYASFAWMDTCLNLTLAIVLAMAFGGSLPRRNEVVGVLALILLAAIAAPILLAWGLGKFHFRGRTLNWMHTRAQEAVDASAQAMRDWRYLFKILVTSLIVFALISVIFYFCFLSLGVHAGLAPLGMFCSLYKFSTYLSITPGNLGLQEVACGVLGEQVQTGGMAVGILASAMLRVFSYLLLAILAICLGGIDLIRKRRQFKP